MKTDKTGAPVKPYAIISYVRGNRTIDNIVRACDLGMDGIGIRERMRITYRQGEHVTEERVLQAVRSMQHKMKEENHPCVISCVQVETISNTE